nr:GNAT family N-acetyltransferase [Candidatus Sigynarchaeota archaeon]
MPVIVNSIDPRELWNQENAALLDYLLADPVANAAILVRASIQHPRHELLYATEGARRELIGCALVQQEKNGHSTIIARGNKAMLGYCVSAFDPGVGNTYEYVSEQDVSILTRSWHITRPDIIRTQYIACFIPNPGRIPMPQIDPAYSLHEYSQVEVKDLAKFNEYEINKASLSLLENVKGYCLKLNDDQQSFIASGYDALSLLPVCVPMAAISGVRVATRARNKGLCKTLLGCLVHQLFAAGKTTQFLYVSPENTIALRCYENCGFVKHATYYRVNSSKDDWVPPG